MLLHAVSSVWVFFHRPGVPGGNQRYVSGWEKFFSRYWGLLWVAHCALSWWIFATDEIEHLALGYFWSPLIHMIIGQGVKTWISGREYELNRKGIRPRINTRSFLHHEDTILVFGWMLSVVVLSTLTWYPTLWYIKPGVHEMWVRMGGGDPSLTDPVSHAFNEGCHDLAGGRFAILFAVPIAIIWLLQTILVPLRFLEKDGSYR